ncbi:MAG: hypothetical protein ACTS5A_02150 [Candidatus Hodgkinia cicadicola]
MSFPGTEEGKTNITAVHKASAVNVRVFSQELNATNCPPKLSNTINIPPKLTYLTLWTSVVFQTEVPSINNSTFHQSNLI